MDADRFAQEYISRHLNFYGSDEVVSRGRQLYRDDKVFFEEYSEKTDAWRLSVQGSQKYHVTVKGVNSKNIQTNCTCPYDWGVLCKHAVAALLFVSDNLGDQLMLQPQKQEQRTISVPSSPRNGKHNGYELPGYKRIDLELIRQNTPPLLFSQLLYSGWHTVYKWLEIDAQSVTFISDKSDIKVRFFKADGNVYVASGQSLGAQKLTMNEAQCLKLIADSPMPDLLEVVFSGQLQARQSEWLRNYGLPPETDFDEYFSYYFSEQDGLMYYPSKKGEGLFPVTELASTYISEIIKNRESGSLQEELVSPKKDRRELGFVLRKALQWDSSYNRSYHAPDDVGYGHYEIVPVIGKTPKSNQSSIVSYMKEYDLGMEFQFDISKSGNAINLLSLIDEINRHEQPDFNLVKKAFGYLQNEKYVYGLTGKGFHLRKQDLVEIELSPEPADVVFEVSKNKEFLELELKIKTGQEVQPRKLQPASEGEAFFFVVGNTYHLVRNEKVARTIASFPEKVRMVATHKDEFFKHLLGPLSQDFEIRYGQGTFEHEKIELDFNKKQLFLSEQNNYVVFTPRVEYDQEVSATLSSSGNMLVKNGDVITEYCRNFELENDFLDSLAELHPDFEQQKERKQFYLHYRDFTGNMWFYRFFDQLQALHVEVFGLKELKNFRYSPFKGRISATLSSGVDWFEVDLAVSFGNNRVSLGDIRKAVINKQRYIQLTDGSVGVLPSEWFHKLEKYFRHGEIKNNKLEISKLRFSVVDELFDQLDDSTILQELAEKRQRIRNFTNITETEVPEQVQANLRHYQKEGLNWLNFLDEMKWGGILADDMGLGKTLQVLSFLQQQANKGRGTNLIVVPTTLLFNWENELKKFTPNLKALYYYGADRTRNTDEFKNYDLVFTSYGVLLRDIQFLSRFRFNYAVLDESQAIKNPASHRYKAACLIDANNKIALTGTPIENSTFDLFAQMSFVNRGFLGAVKKFKESYVIPIDKDGNEAIASELNKIINPFILCRTKEKVASELPDRTESVLYCEMETAQRRVYDAYRNDYRDRLLNKIEEDGIGKSKMMVLEALTRLRQICDSPVLLDSEEVAENQSVKINELVRHITEKTGKHKILVFSQFVRMLGLIRDELDKLNIEYEYLDGQSSSKQREQSVSNFQENDSLRVFLISLKAGGTGLNLTAADYVFLVDPWWNPAVENQAIDRCHRIGQDKKVFAYRMICKDTVEEKILDLQNKKKKIAGDIIQTDENIMKKLDMDDINELFS